jgi:uncharacterized protein
MKDIFRYDKMVEQALRGVVREALQRAAKSGLPGAHHFYVTFRTDSPGVEIPDYLHSKYPSEMTVVLEHQFWDLEVSETHFGVTLSFANRPERVRVPLAAITAFADPSVKFGLQFQDSSADAGAEKPAEKKKPDGESAKLKLAEPPKPEEAKSAKPAGEVVALDAFRKK